MGQLDNLPENSDLGVSDSAEEVLKTVTQNLKALQQDLVAQLSQDVKQLSAEKSRLLNEIEKLQGQHEVLQSEHQALLSRQQLAQQQLWAKQLAQALATHLHALLVQKMNQPADPHAANHPNLSSGIAKGANREEAQQLLTSLDSTLNRTLTSLRQDLTSYQSSLSQQIGRMQTLEQQGEAILQALVNRLSQQLQAETVRRQSGPLPSTENGVFPSTAAGSDVSGAATSPAARQVVTSIPRVPTTVSPTPSTGSNPSPSPTRRTNGAGRTSPKPTNGNGTAAQSSSNRLSLRLQQLSPFQLGLVLILFSTVALSLHNVVVGIIGNPSSIFGVMHLGGYIRLNSLGNSLWILWFRMLIVLPLMTLLASTLYPATWGEIKSFFLSKDRRLLRSVVGSGFFLFLSQVLIYIAIGQVGPGVAVTILFMYPIVTVPLAWFLFGDRPTALRWVVMFAILSGVVLTAFPRLAATANVSWLGVGTAMLSGIAFAFYLIAMQISFRKLHPVPVSVIQFFTIFFLTSLSLLFPLGPRVLPDGQIGFLVGGIILGTLTLMGYLLNNFGVRFMGAARASIIASSGPVLTALLAFLITPGSRTALQGVQWLGILVVTLGVVALSFERMLMQNRAARQAKR